MAVIKHKEQRVGVFIDAQNLYHSAKNLYGGRVNFGNILEDAVAGRNRRGVEPEPRLFGERPA